MRSLALSIGVLVALGAPAAAQEFSYNGQSYADVSAFCNAVWPSWNGTAIGVSGSGGVRCGVASMTTVGALGITRAQYITNYEANCGSGPSYSWFHFTTASQHYPVHYCEGTSSAGTSGTEFTATFYVPPPYSTNCAGLYEWWVDQGSVPTNMDWLRLASSSHEPQFMPLEFTFQGADLTCQMNVGQATCAASQEYGDPPVWPCGTTQATPTGAAWSGFDSEHGTEWFQDEAAYIAAGGNPSADPGGGGCQIPGGPGCQSGSFGNPSGFASFGPEHTFGSLKALADAGQLISAPAGAWEYAHGWVGAGAGSFLEEANKPIAFLRDNGGLDGVVCIAGTRYVADYIHTSGSDPAFNNSVSPNINASWSDCTGGKACYQPGRPQFVDGVGQADIWRFNSVGVACLADDTQVLQEEGIVLCSGVQHATIEYWQYTSIDGAAAPKDWHSFQRQQGYYSGCTAHRGHAEGSNGGPGNGGGPGDGGDLSELLEVLEEIRDELGESGSDYWANFAAAMQEFGENWGSGPGGGGGDLELPDWLEDGPPSEGVPGFELGEHQLEQSRSFQAIFEEELTQSGAGSEISAWLSIFDLGIDEQAVGHYPVWTIDFNLGAGMDFGERDFSLPEWLWDLLYWVTIFSALVYARRLVFGG